MSGYLEYFGIKGWYEALPREIQNGICDAAECPGEMGFKAAWLFEYNISTTTQTAVNLLCNFALNALRGRDHDTCNALLNKAALLCKTTKEKSYCKAIAKRISEEKLIYPDQKQIDAYKPIIYQLIKNNPGILQSDIKKKYPANLENVVGLAHWSNCQEGKVRREKKGRSFHLWVVE